MATLIVMSSCSKKLTYFTDELYDENRWSEKELKRIQFYVSEDIKLVRGSSSGNSRIEDGKIKIKADRKVDEIIIERGTPGVFVFSPKENRFAISFDDDNDLYLMFGPNKKANGRYVLMAKEWKRREGVITYGGDEFYTGSESAYAALMVDIRKAQKSVKKTKTASGRTVR